MLGMLPKRAPHTSFWPIMPSVAMSTPSIVVLSPSRLNWFAFIDWKASLSMKCPARLFISGTRALLAAS